MTRYKYFRKKLDLFPDNIIKEYKLQDIVNNNSKVFCKVHRGMYGLPQAGIITQELLDKHLCIAVYTQSKLTPSYWMVPYKFYSSHQWLWG